MYHSLAFAILLFLVLLILLALALLIALLVLLILILLVVLLIFVAHDSPPLNKMRIVDLFGNILPTKFHSYTSKI